MRWSITAKMEKYKYNYSSMNQGEPRGLEVNWNEWIYGIECNVAESHFLEQNWLIRRIVQGEVTQWLSSWSRWCPLPAYITWAMNVVHCLSRCVSLDCYKLTHVLGFLMLCGHFTEGLDYSLTCMLELDGFLTYDVLFSFNFFYLRNNNNDSFHTVIHIFTAEESKNIPWLPYALYRWCFSWHLYIADCSS